MINPNKISGVFDFTWVRLESDENVEVKDPPKVKASGG